MEQLSHTTMSPARSLITEIPSTVLAAGLLMSAAADAGNLAFRLQTRYILQLLVIFSV